MPMVLATVGLVLTGMGRPYAPVPTVCDQKSTQTSAAVSRGKNAHQPDDSRDFTANPDGHYLMLALEAARLSKAGGSDARLRRQSSAIRLKRKHDASTQEGISYPPYDTWWLCVILEDSEKNLKNVSTIKLSSPMQRRKRRGRAYKMHARCPHSSTQSRPRVFLRSMG